MRILQILGLVVASIILLLPLFCQAEIERYYYPSDEQYDTNLDEDPDGITSEEPAKKSVLKVSPAYETFENEWNSFVSYKIIFRDGKKSSCGGVIIGDKQILTAAHCVSGDNIQAIEVGLGTILTVPNWTKDVKLVNMKKICIHSRYHKSPNQFDFAILNLEASVQAIESRMKAASLPDMSATKYSELNLIGAGRNGPGEREWPQKIQVLPVAPIKCPAKESIMKMCFKEDIEDNYDANVFKGDDGSPILSRDRNREIVHGIIGNIGDTRKKRGHFVAANTYFHDKEIRTLMSLCTFESP